LVFGGESDARLRQLGHVRFHDTQQNPTPEDMIRQLPGAEIVVTCWGTPSFRNEGMLEAADKLKVIAHAAGSVRGMCPEPVYARGIEVTSSASAIAGAVADLNLSLTMHMLRRVYEFDRLLRNGGWANPMKELGREVSGAAVGVVGAGFTGRCFIDLLQRMEAEVWVYDPYLTDADAEKLDVCKSELLALFTQCDVVSMQAPVTDETKGMITAEHFKAMKDGAIFINTARGVLVDQEALLAELKTGRIAAALDVFTPEPIPEDHEVRSMDNVVLSPHIGGATIDARKRQGALIVDELVRHLDGQPMQYRITERMRAIMA
jgi:phosphoglycerate dehydrogenase-like enzyme